ncbi:MAG TPA: M48 family metalloprotease [Terriglobia bacterium]|nr:M48 family metalloprotease [Terriglobia bacterium]
MFRRRFALPAVNCQMLFVGAILALLVLQPPPDPEIPPISLEDRISLPYSELLEPASYSQKEFESLRSRIEHERDEKIESLKKTEKLWKDELDAARSELEELNRGKSVDTPGTSARRTQLHIDIGALERGIPEKVHEQKVTIPGEYDERLAKLWLIEHWPERRDEILQRIEQGSGRERRHGDVDDIGYRHIAKDPQEDIGIGRQAARQMAAGGWLPAELQDVDVQNYVRKVADRIAANSDLKVPLHVTVVDSGDLRATALPGGFLFVPSGVLLASHTESELAGILSREIARIAARQVSRASKRSLVSRMFMPIAQIATGVFSGGINPGAYYGIGYGMQGLSGIVDRVMDGDKAKYQKEADQLGIQYAWKAGFDPRGSLEFLESQEADAGLHERILNLFSEITYLRPQKNAVVDSPEFQAVRARLRTHTRPPS